MVFAAAIYYLVPLITNLNILTELQKNIALASTILFLILITAYLIKKTMTHELDKIIKQIDDLGPENSFAEIKIKNLPEEYRPLLEKLNKITDALRANIDNSIVSSISAEKSNDELKVAYEKLKELDSLKADFLANVSHELRTPLISVEGYMEYLNTGKFGELNEKQKKSLTSSLEGIKRLKKMINQLLLYSNLDAKIESIDLVPTNIEELTKTVINEYVGAANKKSLKLTFYLDKDLPEVNIDKEKIRVVLSSLIDNAIKFTEKGEVRVIIQKTDVGIRVSIADTGVGIPEYYKNRLSDKFSQLDGSTSRKYGGVGLGLAVVKGLLEMHNIKINVESKQNRGSVFYFTINPRG